MTIIKSAEIPYLNEDVIEKYNNVIIKSAEGLMMKINALMLCSMSRSLKMALLEFDDFHDDHMITTEFSLEELKQVKEYCTKGSSDAMTESIMNSFGLLTPLSVCLKRQEKWNKNEINKNNQKKKHSPFSLLESKPVFTNYDNSLVQTIIPVKNEFVDIKNEPLEDLEFDLALGYSSDDSLPLSNYAKTFRKRGAKRQKASIKDDDIDWQQEKLPGNKAETMKVKERLDHKKSSKAHVKQRQKTSIKVDDNDLKSKSRGRPRLLPSNYNTWSDPWSDNDFELFKKFELPKPLQQYVSKPKKFDAKKFEESMNDENKHFQCPQCQMKFENSWNLDAHEIKFHCEHFQCPSCDTVKNVEDVEEFKKHVFEHIGMDHVQVKCSQKVNFEVKKYY